MIVPNIGPRECRKRHLFGLGMLVVAVAMGGALITAGIPRWWRFALVVPFWLAALGVFQARGMT